MVVHWVDDNSVKYNAVVLMSQPCEYFWSSAAVKASLVFRPHSSGDPYSHLGVPVVTASWLTGVAKPQGKTVSVSIAMSDVKQTHPPSRRLPWWWGGGWRPPARRFSWHTSGIPEPFEGRFLTTICFQTLLDHNRPTHAAFKRQNKTSSPESLRTERSNPAPT